MEQDAIEQSILVAETAEDIKQFIASLPHLSLEQLPSSDNCPICLIPFSSIISESLHGAPNGITKLKCGHVFCLSDISEWINTPRGSCPTCRDIFMFIPEPSEEESSDGGEYIPGSDLTDEFMDEEYWSEEEEDWIESEADLFEGHSLDESNSSWNSHMDETSAPAHGQLICIDEPSDSVPPNVPDIDIRDFTETLTHELIQLRDSVYSIQPSDLQFKKEHVDNLLNLSLSKTKEMKRILDTHDASSHFQHIVKLLEAIDVRVQNILDDAIAQP